MPCSGVLSATPPHAMLWLCRHMLHRRMLHRGCFQQQFHLMHAIDRRPLLTAWLPTTATYATNSHTTHGTKWCMHGATRRSTAPQPPSTTPTPLQPSSLARTRAPCQSYACLAQTPCPLHSPSFDAASQRHKVRASQQGHPSCALMVQINNPTLWWEFPSCEGDAPP